MATQIRAPVSVKLGNLPERVKNGRDLYPRANFYYLLAFSSIECPYLPMETAE